jgi:hypothetical protein
LIKRGDVEPQKRDASITLYNFSKVNAKGKRKGEKKGSPLRETSAAHGACMVFCLLGEEWRFAEAASLTTWKRSHAVG